MFGAIRAPESRDALIELARLNQDGQVRTAAVTALGELEDPTTIPTLSEALKDEVWSVKAAAAQALSMIPSVDSVPALAEALGKNDGGTGRRHHQGARGHHRRHVLRQRDALGELVQEGRARTSRPP